MNPADVKADFASGLTDVTAFYAAANTALSGDKDKTLLVENTFLATAVLWEGFVSDLIVAYINRDSSRFAVHLRAALEDNLTPKQKRIYSSFATLSIPAHLKKSEVIDLIDAQGNNITFSNYKEMKDASARWLTPANAARIAGLTARRRSVINAVIAIRNQIAHRSKRSLVAMNEALAAGGLHGTGLQRGVNTVRHVGAYLKAQPAGHASKRIEIFLSQLHTISAAL